MDHCYRDPRLDPKPSRRSTLRPATHQLSQLTELFEHCRMGRLYDVEAWIRRGKPLQLDPSAVPKGRRIRSPLEIGLKAGSHSLCQLLLCNGYRLEMEPEPPLNLALRGRRWDLVDMLLAWGADPHTVDLTTLFDTYNRSLFERFRDEGVDLTDGHELASALAYHPGNKPLFGFVKRHLVEEPSYQQELNIALGYHVRTLNKKGISLSIWAGADPYAVAPDLEYGLDDDEGYECAIEQAAEAGDVDVLRRFRPDPTKVDFDHLYQTAANETIVEFLAEVCPPKNLTPIVQRQCFRISTYWHRERHDWRGALLAVLRSGARWEGADKQALAGIRMELLRASDYELKEVLSALREADVCSPEIFEELTRTPTMQKRMLQMRLIRPKPKPISKAEKQRREFASFSYRFDRERLYEEVWANPASEVAKSYRISGVYLGRVCRTLRVPVPPRGYWAKLRSGKTVRKPPLRDLPKSIP